VSLWDLLTLLAVSLAFSGAIVAARSMGGGFGRGLVAVLSGLVIGVSATLFVRMVTRRLLGKGGRHLTDSTARLAYLGAVVSMAVSLFIGFLFTRGVIRLVGL
jgi:hypothetical protein